jgi:hypothetical protein
VRSSRLVWALLGVVLVLVGAAGGYLVSAALDDDGTASTATDDGASSTTTPAAPSGAAVPIVTSSLGVIGRWDGHAWVRLDSPVPTGIDFTFLPLGGRPIPATVRSVGTTCEISQETTLPFVELDPTFDGDRVIAVHGVADPLPRAPEELDRGSDTYRRAASDALRTVGIKDPKPDLRQLLRVDLDGDGSDEVLITAERIDRSDQSVAKGEYTAVILRRLVDGQVRSEVLEHFAVADRDDAETPYLLEHHVAAIGDLNGDGTLEVVLASDYYEGSALTMYTDVDGRLVKGLGAGCGA